MTNSDPIGLWLAASVVTGLAAHVALAARNRRAYRRLRDADLIPAEGSRRGYGAGGA